MSPYDLSGLLRIGISSRALFDLEAEDRIYKKLGLQKYREAQLENEYEVLEKGTAFPLVEGLLAFNKDGKRRVEIIVISKNHPETGLRVFHSIRHYGLDITRAAFTGGESLNPYLEAFDIELFLSRSSEDVQEAVDAGIAAAVLYNPPSGSFLEADQLRIAFDADAVLFSEESEAIAQESLEAFWEHEHVNANTPLNEGPFANLLRKLYTIQREFDPKDAPVRIAIVTARNSPAHERVIKTLRAWGVGVDSAFFLGGISKDRILKAFRAHIFFDDQHTNLLLASASVPSALVPYRTNSILRQPQPQQTVERELPQPDISGQVTEEATDSTQDLTTHPE
jgi:5'-nucleotidase